MNIILTISDIELAILKTHLLDPEKWVKNVMNEKIRKCMDRVYEGTTEKIAKKRTKEEKLIELDKYDIAPRTVIVEENGETIDSGMMLVHQDKDKVKADGDI